MTGLCAASSVISREEDQYLLSNSTYEALSAARELMQKEDFAQAEAGLLPLLNNNPSPYETAVIQQTLGHIYFALDKHAEAATAFIKSIETHALPGAVTHDIQYIIAQLLASTGKYKESLDYLLPWLESEASPKPEALVLAGTIYYQLNDFRNMIPPVQKALSLSGNPEQSWYEMLLAGYYQLKEYKEAATELEKMIVRFPENKTYWQQLAGAWQLAGVYQRALAAYELALNKGILDTSGLMQLIHLYLHEQLPYKAATLLRDKINSGEIDNSIENLDLLASSWLLAREYDPAIKVLTELAQLKNDPGLYFRIGQIYFEKEKWQEAIVALERVTKDGNAANLAEAWLLIGIAAFHNHEEARSARALNQAVSYETTRKQAEWWLNRLSGKLSEKNS